MKAPGVLSDKPFEAKLLASRPFAVDNPPFLTVAIPHYKHRRYLEKVLQSLFEQDFDDFEILISDDMSPDDSNQVIPGLLQQGGRAFQYYAQEQNLGYDGNVRFCLAAAHGRYVFLLGNDDALKDHNTLREVKDQLHQLQLPEVAFTNYEEWSEPASSVKRALNTQILGAGPDVALRFFRTFSFVSGLIYEREAAARYDTSRWDQSVYYQIYLACRILAEGGRLGAVEVNAVRKDVQIDGQTVPNYITKWSKAKWSLQTRHTGLQSVMRVTADGILPSLPRAKRSRALRHIIAQVLTTSYAHWLFEYRRISNWGVAFGVARDLWPGSTLAEYPLTYRHRMQLWIVYLGVTFVGLTAPARIVNEMKSRLANALRRRQQNAAKAQ